MPAGECMSRKFDLALLPPSPNLQFEMELWDAGVTSVAGIDEAGRGALAGPVAAAAVILPQDPTLVDRLEGVRDSKQMTARAREEWAPLIERMALTSAVEFVPASVIDEIGIAPATRLAARRALTRLVPQPQHLLIDYIRLEEVEMPQTSLVKGDARSLSIACASVLAKVARDSLLRQLDGQYPGYGFARHKGYATAAHRAAIHDHGPCPEHRLTFSPMRQPELPGL